MQFFTREWYDSIQETSRSMGRRRSWDTAMLDRMYKEARTQYAKYLDTIHDRINPDVATLMNLHLHDARLVKVEPSDQALSLILEDTYNRRVYDRQLTIVFYGVNSAVGIDDFVGQDIDYDEISINPDGTFVYSALSHKREFSICFQRVSVSILNRNNQQGGTEGSE